MIAECTSCSFQPTICPQCNSNILLPDPANDSIHYCNSKTCDYTTSPIKTPVARNNKAYSVKSIRKSHPNAYKEWTAPEEDQLIIAYNNGYTIKEITTMLERKRVGILSRLRKLGYLH